MRFRTKLFLTSSLVVLLLWSGTVWPIQRMIRASFSHLADEHFAGTRQSLASAQAEQVNRLCQAGTLVMQIPELRALIAEHNFEIAKDNLDSLQERIDSLAGLLDVNFVCVLDGRGTLIAQNSHSPWPALADLKTYIDQSPQAKPLMRQLYTTQTTSSADVQRGKYGLWVYRGRLYQMVGLPLIFNGEEGAPARPDGALIVATPVTDALATDLGEDQNCQISFLADGAVMASSLDLNLRQELLQNAAGGNWKMSAPFDMTLGRSSYRSYVEPLIDPCSKTPVGTMAIQTSLSEGLALQETISRSLLLIMAGGLAIAGLISFALSAAITRPVHALVDGARRVASGDLETSLRVTRRDELGQLATAFNDMVVQLRARAELQRLVDESQAASKAKSQFLANMSHEIRTPLHGVIGMANLLLGTDLDDRQRHFAQLVKSSTEVLTTLINDILDFSKIEAGKLEIESIDFDLHAVVEDVVELLSQKAFAKNVDMLCDIAGDVPTMLRGDPNRLRQILMNLIGNAVKFTAQGEVIVRVELAQIVDGACTVRFAISDTGLGVPQERLDRLFKSFSQVDASTTRKFGGTGLGLAISKQLVELMGGSIGVQSESGMGSTFHFTARFEQLDCPLPISTTDFAGMKALVIDTQTSARQITQRNLTDLGMHPTTAASTDEAIKLLAAAKSTGNPFSLVLIDQRVDGFKQITTDHGPRYILLMTAATALKAAEVTQLGFAAGLVKPIRKFQLRHAAAAALGLKIFHENKANIEIPTISPNAKSRRILVAEDNEVNQIVASEFLSKAGYHAQVVGDGRAAVQAIEKEPYDLVLMDCQMPVMDGFEATQAIRQHETRTSAPRRVPIIALTANASGADRARCHQAGMDGYCGKPFKPNELLNMISEFLGNEQQIAPPKPPSKPIEKTPFAIAGVMESCGGNPTLAVKVLDKFAGQITEAISELSKCIEVGDAQQLARLSHSLKGTAGVVAADVLRQKFAQLESLGRSNALDRVDDCLKELKQEINLCLDHIPCVKTELGSVQS